MKDSTILEARELAFLDRVRPVSSKIWHLSEELFTEAVKAYLGGVSFAKIRVMLADAGVLADDLPSQAGWVKFWGSFRPFLRVARRRAAMEGVSACAAEARQSGAEFDEAIIDLVRQLAFELVDSEGANAKEVNTLVGLLLKHKDQKLKERLVGVAERRVAVIEKEKGMTETEPEKKKRQMSQKQRERRYREIFGLPPEEEPRAKPRKEKHPETPKNTPPEKDCSADAMSNEGDKLAKASFDDPIGRPGDESPPIYDGRDGDGGRETDF